MDSYIHSPATTAIRFAIASLYKRLHVVLVMSSSPAQRAVEMLHRKRCGSTASDVSTSEWDPWEIPQDDFRIEGKIGSGITADVFRGVWRGTAVAVKQIKLSEGRMNAKIVEAFKRELTVMVRCRHPNLVLFMGAATLVPPIRLLSEFCEGGTLFDLVHLLSF